MSSPSSNAIPDAIHEGHEADWAARLIPGDECSDKRQKKNLACLKFWGVLTLDGRSVNHRAPGRAACVLLKNCKEMDRTGSGQR
jgi:hypothetical protein